MPNGKNNQSLFLLSFGLVIIMAAESGEISTLYFGLIIVMKL